jgi:hypothetical protein
VSERFIGINFSVINKARMEYFSGESTDWHGALRDILVDGQLINDIGEKTLPLETIELQDLPRGTVLIGLRSATEANTKAWAHSGEYELPDGKELGAPSDEEVEKFCKWADEKTASVMLDEETQVIAACYERLQALPEDARDRVLDYLRGRFNVC